MAKHLLRRRKKRLKVDEKQLRKQYDDDNGELLYPTMVGMERYNVNFFFKRQFEL